MKRSQLREIVLEAMKGYSKYAPGGETKGGTTDDFRNILTAIAKERPEEEPKPEVKEDADKTRAEHLGTLRGSLMHVKTLLDAERPHNEILAYVEKALKQVSSSDVVSEGDRKLYSKEEAINYIENNPPVKYYKIGVSKGSSRVINDPAEAIQVIQDSPISQFELDTYGQVIQFSAPFDAGHAAAVRGMGGLD